MSFLSPIFLLGLPLVGVPIAIHLLNRRQKKVVAWGAMKFLMAGMTRRRRLWRMQDILLLLLRVFALLFFIAALSRPLVPLSWLGRSGPRDVVLILDQSMSTSRRAGEGTLFDLQILKAFEALESLTSSDRFHVMLGTEAPRWLFSEPMEASGRNLGLARKQLQALRPTLGGVDWPACLDKALEFNFGGESMAKVISVIADGQKHGWKLEQSELWSSLKDKRQNHRLPVTINVVEVGTDLGKFQNVSVSKLDSIRAVCASDALYHWQAVVRNDSDRSSESTTLEWFVDDRSVGLSSVPGLAPGAETKVEFQFRFDGAGVRHVRGELESDDSLSADDTASWIVEVVDALPVLVVEGASYADPAMTDSGFISAALGASSDSKQPPRWKSVFQPRVIQAERFDEVDLSDFRLAILSNISNLSSAGMSKLEDYVEHGGGLWIALGDQTVQETFNQRFFNSGMGLVPASLASVSGDSDNREVFYGIQPPSAVHPATRLLADTELLDLDRVQVYRSFVFDESNRESLSVLMRMDHGRALAIENQFGAGRTIALGMPLSVAWSNLPLRQAFVAMLHEWLWHLTEPSITRRNLRLGDPILQPIAKDREIARVELAFPDGRRERPFVFEEETVQLIRHGQADQPGDFTLLVETEEDGETAFPYTVARDAEESDLAPLDREEESAREAFAGIQWNQDLLTVAPNEELKIPEQPLDHWLLGFLALVLAGEMALAIWMIHQRSRPVRAASMKMDF